MKKLSTIPRVQIKRMIAPRDTELKRHHKWWMIWGMMSMLDHTEEQMNDWMILNRFQRRYL